jgi:hypothetical protein
VIFYYILDRHFVEKSRRSSDLSIFLERRRKYQRL